MKKALLLIPLPGLAIGGAMFALATLNPANQPSTLDKTAADRQAAVITSRGAELPSLQLPSTSAPADSPASVDTAHSTPAVDLDKAVRSSPAATSEAGEIKATQATTNSDTETNRRAIITHTVREGETLGQIADQYGISVDSILWANGLTDADELSIGQQLKILPVSGILHVVGEGDNLTDLAERYGSDVFAIIDVNGLTNPDELETGAELVIPGGKADAPATPAGSSQRSIYSYEVSEGDTLSAIANQFGITIQTILRANGLEESSVLQPGQTLTILPTSGLLHVVQAGETLNSIAGQYDSSVQEIVAANGVSDGDALQPGDKLVIPSREGWQPPTPTEPEPAMSLVDYVVQAGDTVSALAERLGIPTSTLIQINDLRDPFILVIGQQLRVPANASGGPLVSSAPEESPVALASTDGGPYEVRPGDTLFSIASAFGVRQDALIQANGLQDPFIIQVGQQLEIPGQTAASQETAPAPAPEQPEAAPAQVTATPEPTPEPQPTAVPTPEPPQPAPTPEPPQPEPTPAPPPPPPAPTQEPAPPPAPSGDRSSVVSIAMKFVGAPYVWGGTTPQGFDCSGLVMYVYRAAGFAMPRDLWGQLQQGSRVGRGDLQPGDIVFFVNTYTSGLSHNGIYIGDGKFVHAAREGVGVTVSALSEAYWASRYYGASRP